MNRGPEVVTPAVLDSLALFHYDMGIWDISPLISPVFYLVYILFSIRLYLLMCQIEYRLVMLQSWLAQARWENAEYQEVKHWKFCYFFGWYFSFHTLSVHIKLKRYIHPHQTRMSWYNFLYTQLVWTSQDALEKVWAKPYILSSSHNNFRQQVRSKLI